MAGARPSPRQLTSLQRTVLRWAELLGGVRLHECEVWTMRLGRPQREWGLAWMVPMGLESSRWRGVSTQVAELRRRGLLVRLSPREATATMVLTELGREALRA